MTALQDIERVEALFASGQKVKAMFQARELAIHFLPGHEARLESFVGRARQGTWQLPRDIPKIESDFYYWIGQRPPENKHAAKALTYCARWLNDTPCEIGYVRDDYATDAFILLWGLVPRFEPPAGATTPNRRPKAHDQQEQEILRAVAALGYNPLALPPFSRGRRGVKSEVEVALGEKGHWTGSTVFAKAWGRLLKKGELMYADSA